jgi:hypothetical protein
MTACPSAFNSSTAEQIFVEFDIPEFEVKFVDALLFWPESGSSTSSSQYASTQAGVARCLWASKIKPAVCPVLLFAKSYCLGDN